MQRSPVIELLKLWILRSGAGCTKVRYSAIHMMVMVIFLIVVKLLEIK